MNRFSAFIVIFLYFSALSIFGQTSTEAELNKIADQAQAPQPPKHEVRLHNIGLAVGYVSGFGLSYRRWFSDYKNGIQLTFAPFYQENKKADEKFVNASFGINGLRLLNEGRVANLFLYYGVHGWYYVDRHHETQWSYSSNYNVPSYEYDTLLIDEKQMIQTGIGAGVDLHYGRLSYNLMVGIRGGYDMVWKERFVKLTAETAVYYAF